MSTETQNRISERELLRDLRCVASMLGRTPSKTDYDAHGKHSTHTIRNRFGSWNVGVEAAGLEPNQKNAEVPEEEVLADIKHVANEMGETPTVREYDRFGEYSSSTVRRKFQSWTDAVEMAGFEPQQQQSHGLTDDELLADLVRVADKLGKPPTRSEYNYHGEVCESTVRSRFDEPFHSLAVEAYDISQEFGGFHLTELVES